MTAEVIQYEDAAARLARDRQIFRLKLHAVPNWQICETLQCSPSDIDAAMHRMGTGVTPEFKNRVLELDMARLDELHKAYYEKALAGDKGAAVLCLRFIDRRAKFCGLDTLPRAEALADDSREPSSFDQVYEVIMRLARGPTIEGEVVQEGEPPKSD